MRSFDFQIVIEKEIGDPGYMAYCPALQGCFSNGATVEAARSNLRKAIAQHITVLREMGQPVPSNVHFVHVEELSVSVLE